jgi:hypothetical protein
VAAVAPAGAPGARGVEEAADGEPWAIRELLDRTLGKPSQAVELDAGPDERMTFEVKFAPPRAQGR